MALPVTPLSQTAGFTAYRQESWLNKKKKKKRAGGAAQDLLTIIWLGNSEENSEGLSPLVG